MPKLSTNTKPINATIATIVTIIIILKAVRRFQCSGFIFHVAIKPTHMEITQIK